MRVYVELHEVVESEDIEPDLVRIDVTDWSKEDIDTLVKELKNYADSNYEHYRLFIHYCRHDEGGSCSFALIGEK